jgi:tetratricopeptide (TPR) repeat protein
MNPTLVLLGTWNLLLLLLWCPRFIMGPGHIAEAFRQYFLRTEFSLPVLAANWSLFMVAAADLAGILSAAWVAGGLSARLAGRKLEASPIARFGFGLGLLATGTLAAGLTGLLFAPPPWAIHPLLAVLGAAVIQGEWPAIRRLPSRLPELPPLTPVSRGMLAVAGVFAVAGLLNVEMAWDALTYHLRLPTFYVYNHKFYDVWHHYCAPFPFLVEMSYALALLVQGEYLARYLNAAYSILLLSSLMALAREAGVRGRWALLLAAASPLFLVLFDRAYIDPGFAFFLTLSLVLFARWWRTGSVPAIVASGIFTGLGLSCKYTGIFFVAGLAAAAAPRLKTREGRRAALLWSGAALLPFLPWLAKDFLFRANPVWPYLGALFGTRADIPQDVTPFFASAHPLSAFLHNMPAKLSALALDNGRVDGPLLPAIAGFLPLIALAPATPMLAMLRRAVLGYLLAWFILAPDARFLLPILPAICILVESSVERLMDSGRGARSMTRTFLEASLVLGAYSAAAIQWVFFAPFSMPLGLESAHGKLALGLTPPPWNSYTRDYVNTRTPKDARIMFLCHFSTYYYERVCLADFHYGTGQITKLLRERQTAPEIGKRLRQTGFRWLLSVGPGAAAYLKIPGYFSVPDAAWREWKIMLSRHAEAAWQTDNFTLYRLGPAHRPRPLPVLPVFESIEFEKVDSALEEGRPQEAIQLLKKVSPLLRDVGSTWLRSGDARTLAGDYAGALADFRRAASLGVDTPRLHLGMAHALLRLGRASEAIPHAEDAWRQNPLSAYTAATAATVYGTAGNLARARELVREALRLNPGNEDYRALEKKLELNGGGTR